MGDIHAHPGLFCADTQGQKKFSNRLMGSRRKQEAVEPTVTGTMQKLLHQKTCAGKYEEWSAERQKTRESDRYSVCN